MNRSCLRPMLVRGWFRMLQKRPRTAPPPQPRRDRGLRTLALGLLSSLATLGVAQASDSLLPLAAPAPATSVPNHLQLKPGPDGLVLSWFGKEGVPCQVESSTDGTHWSAVGPVVIGTNAWVSMPVAQVMIPSDSANPTPGDAPATAPDSGTGPTMALYRIKDLAAAALALEESASTQPAAVTAIFATSTGGLLSIFGDNLDNQIEVSRNAAGIILVNRGAVQVLGGTPTVANTVTIQVFGLGGNDTLTLNEATGALPKAILFGGTGNDSLTGGSSADQLFGQAGNDVLLGRGGTDFLFGGTENDTLTGGDSDDQVFGESGNDRFVWNPGDDTDLNEGGAGSDTVEVNGGNGAEQFTTTANGTRVRFDRLDPAPFSIDMGTCEKLVLNANGGDDRHSATGNLAALIQITVDGGSGNDQILGSNGVDLLLGGDGNDFIDGQQGNDVAFLGAGNDVFQWDPGDGSDVVEGQDGTDQLTFHGSAADEIFETAANGGRVRFTRNIGGIVMDLDDVEQITVEALNGTDSVIVSSLVGTDLTQAEIHLSGVLGGTTPDTSPDTIIVNGSNGADILDVFGAGSTFSVVGLQPSITVRQSAGTNDTLVINALGGNDGVTASTVPAGVVRLTLDGGAGNDTLLGHAGADVLLGGDGDDFVDGQQGNDVAFLGAGNDVFQWDPGDGNDTVEGQVGVDVLRFFGSSAAENIDVIANGGRVLFLRNIANVTMDLDDVDQIEFRALGGADNIVVGDLTGTDITRIGLDLRGPAGGGDGQSDTITVNGTQGVDTFGAVGDAGGVRVFGLAAVIDIFQQESANDRLVLNGLGEADVIDATSLEADGIQLVMNGGLGADLFLGSEGNDLVTGGDGNDTALLGAGRDTFVWNPGDDNDTIEGQAGLDTLLFNGANIAEIIDISANGGRVRFTRNVASVVMDLNDVEAIRYNALGGADTVVVGDLTATDATSVELALAGANGSGDAQPDNVIVTGTSNNDAVIVAGSTASGVRVVGLPAQVSVTGSEPANDRLTLNLLAKDDVLDASGLATGVIALTADGGDGDDILTGSAGDDVLRGGAGDDVLVGGPGNDVLDGGSGNNVLIQ